MDQIHFESTITCLIACVPFPDKCYNMLSMATDEIFLNISQKQSIEYIKGPLLIVAGAGTGKTTTLVEKIKHIVKEDFARTDEIACLTFTEKAAYEMEERVDRAMPYGYFQMWISTFHAFADEILRNDIHQIGLNPSYNLMTQAQSQLFLKQHLFEIKLKHFRPISNPNKFIGGLLQHFSRLQDEDIPPIEYAKWVKQQPNNNELFELSNAYSTYQKLKIKNDVMDFGDLIYYLNELFRKRPKVLKSYQYKFKYLMVDEFQDTNIAQYELIKLLCPPKSNPNLTVVGDDSQAIYKFRGASISNILTFMDDYKKAKQISLQDNYRSNQTLLDHAYALIQNNNPDTLESKLGISKELKSHSKNILNAVNFELFNTSDDESDWIADKILELKTKNDYEFKDCAVLVRANNHSELIISALKRKGIPYQFLGPGTLFKQPEVKDLIAYLQFLSDFDDSIALYRVLSMKIFALGQEDVFRFITFAKKISQPLFLALEIFQSFQTGQSRRTDFEIYKEHLPMITTDSKEKLTSIISMIKNHIDSINKDTAGEILFKFLEESNYLSKLSNPENETEQKQTLNVTKFFNRIKEIENEQENPSIFTVNDYIKMSLELGESPSASDTDLVSGNAVNILTVHGSKGLEFPVVFLSNLINGRFPTHGRPEQVPIPEGIIKEQLPEGDYHIQEERRLFYVGITRAKDLVYLTSARSYGRGVRKHKISPFVIEAMGQDFVDKKPIIKPTDKQQLSIFDFKKTPETFISNPIELKNISYSQIEAYERCPLQYKYQYILKIPTAPGSAASFGSTIHAILQKFYRGFAKDNTWGLSHLINLLESSWVPIGYNSKAHQLRMKKEAKEMLENYYNSFHSPEIEIIDLEKLFKIRINSSIFLTGKIDRVDKKSDGKIEVIDYKTGKRPDDKKLAKNMQLTIYATAASNPGMYNKPVEKIDLTFYYLQAREKVTFNRTVDDLKVIKDNIESVVGKIRNQDFPPNVGRHCNYCSFRMICDAWK